MSLFQRLTSPGENEEKIAINKFCGLLNEYYIQQVDREQIVQILNLDQQEVEDLDKILPVIYPQKIINISYFLMLGELNVYTPKDYSNEVEFWERVNGT